MQLWSISSLSFSSLMSNDSGNDCDLFCFSVLCCLVSLLDCITLLSFFCDCSVSVSRKRNPFHVIFLVRNRKIIIWIVGASSTRKNFEISWYLETASMPTLILFLSSPESHVAPSLNNSAASKK